MRDSTYTRARLARRGAPRVAPPDDSLALLHRTPASIDRDGLFREVEAKFAGGEAPRATGAVIDDLVERGVAIVTIIAEGGNGKEIDWGARLDVLGAHRHIIMSSEFGPWREGEALLGELLPEIAG